MGKKSSTTSQDAPGIDRYDAGSREGMWDVREDNELKGDAARRCRTRDGAGSKEGLWDVWEEKGLKRIERTDVDKEE